MKAKPKGAKYRNLHARGAVIYFERILDGARVRFSTKTSDWDEAAAVRDLYLKRRSERRAQGRPPCPTFGAAAKSVLDWIDELRESGAVDGFAATTALVHRRSLAADTLLVRSLGAKPLDEIDAPSLRAWYEVEVIGRNLSPKSGENRLDSVSLVFRWARERGLLPIQHDPVRELRAQLKAGRRTKRARAARDAARRLAKAGVLSPAEVGRLVGAARAEGLEALVVVLLAVECGLRRGEIAGLRWGHVCWGTGEADPSRRIEVRLSNSSGLGDDAPKGGKVRAPHVSRRLYRALQALARSRFEPGPSERIVRRNYFDLSHVTLRRVLRRAGLPSRSFQNLRATASSLLKQWGVAPAYVLAAIGHEGEAVAAAHYDALDFSTYREPERLAPGDTPMDLFERLCGEESPQESPHLATDTRKAPRLRALGWRPQRESNPCYRLERAES